MTEIQQKPAGTDIDVAIHEKGLKVIVNPEVVEKQRLLETCHPPPIFSDRNPVSAVTTIP
jgi:hypothetical protein